MRKQSGILKLNGTHGTQIPYQVEMRYELLEEFPLPRLSIRGQVQPPAAVVLGGVGVEASAEI